MDTLYASFTDVTMAQKAAAALLDHGFEKDHLSLIANIPHADDQPAEGETPLDPVESAKKGISTTTGGDAAAGAAKGAGVGLLVGGLAVLASLFIPGFGFVVGGGALATALMAGAGTTAAGALAGGVTGYLVDQGVPREIAADYGKAMETGGAIIAVHLGAEEHLVQAREILAKYQSNQITLHTVAEPAGRVITSAHVAN